MKLTVLGMPSRDAIAFDMFMQKSMTEWTWEHMLATHADQRINADILVVDMAAHGWAQGNDANLAQLKQLVGQNFAVLLVSAQDHTWARLMAALPMPQWIWLGKPYGAHRMREVLAQFAAHAQNTPHSTTSLRNKSAVPVKTVGVDVHPTRQLKHAGSPSAPTLSPDILAAQLALAPLERYILLRQMLNGIQTRIPFEMRFTVQNSLIVNPEDAWVATNTPLPVIARVCDSSALAAAVSVRALEASEAEERAHRLGMAFKDMYTFLHEISAGLRMSKTDN
nr:hypothetical protein [uncultured Rhodoferax sp.]